MTCAGSRNSRAKQALRNIGPAVLNGGFSTFISISLLARSQSLAFISFYKVKNHEHVLNLFLIYN